MRHAAPEEIVAFRDHEPVDREVEQHIRSCLLCRRQLGEARWVRTHTRSHILEPSGPEPTRDEISAYLDEGLDESEMARVETHIRTNDRCLALFDQLLLTSQQSKDPIPDPGHVDRLKARLREPKLLGRLRVFVTDRFKQVFHPARPGEPALRRAARTAAEPDGTLPCMEAPVPCSPVLACADRMAGPPSPPRPSKPRVIDTGIWLIRAVTSSSTDGPQLELMIEETASGAPVPGVQLKLEPGWDDPVHARTDEEGTVIFPLPEGESRLEIGDGPELVLEINADLDQE